MVCTVAFSTACTETYCVGIRLLQSLVPRVQSLEGALDLCSSFCSAAQRLCDLENVGDTHKGKAPTHYSGLFGTVKYMKCDFFFFFK